MKQPPQTMITREDCEKALSGAPLITEQQDVQAAILSTLLRIEAALAPASPAAPPPAPKAEPVPPAPAPEPKPAPAKRRTRNPRKKAAG